MGAAKVGLGGALTAGLLRRRPSSSLSSTAAATPSIIRISRRSPAASLSRGCSRPCASATSDATTSPPAEIAKEKDVVFVAGATGRVGSRAVRELIKLGFRVRAAVRDAQRATSLVQSVQQLRLGDEADTSQRLEIVECDLEKQPQGGIVAAIGNASLVVCSVGASEKEILDVTGPYRIDYIATNNLVQAATAAKVEHFILVTSLGTNKIGFPAFLLNLFWGVLCWKRRAEEALIASGIPYTIIRPGGMERPTDAYKETHNLVVAAEDTYVGGQVSNLQVAELIGYMAENRKAAYCKVVEVIAETTAPLLPMDQLLSIVPSKREPPAEEEDKEEMEKEVSAATAVETPPLPPSPPPPPATAGVAKAEQPLSPYTAYEGLKPPSSPSSALSSKRLQVEEQQGEAATSSPTSGRPLSPYTAYEDLKPPSSPSAAPKKSSMISNSDDDTVSLVDKKIQVEEKEEAATPAATPSRPLSPYTAFVDLKPPSSPSPLPPSSSSTSSSATNITGAATSSVQLDPNANGTPIGSIGSPSDQVQGENKQPLSPYTRYEELKPPSSPTPSAPKI